MVLAVVFQTVSVCMLCGLNVSRWFLTGVRLCDVECCVVLVCILYGLNVMSVLTVVSQCVSKISTYFL